VEKRKVVIAEDHTILREGLRALLATEADLDVVAEAENGREAVHLVNVHKPDLVLMDITMPMTNGPEAIRMIKRRHPEVKVLTLTVHKTDAHIRLTLQSGADGYALKDDSRSELLTAIRHVLKGKKYLSPGVCKTVLSGYLDDKSSTSVESRFDSLTSREREILKLIAEGYKNRQMADHLSVSLKTIEKHRSNLMRKLDLHSGPALTAYAFENGLISSTG
jgi:DNA-binding NarL/FixJ family response regulator